jgi:uncharacterized protein YaiL (DUF2058 family)
MAKLSLQEQLLKSGLVSAAQAKSVKSDKRKQTQQQRHNKVEVVDEAKQLAQQAQAEKIERDRELNQLRRQQEEQKELAAQIKQIIELNRLPRDAEGLAYNFTDNNKVKRLYVSEAMRDQIAQGRQAIVKFGQQYEVVSAEVAQKIQSRDAACVIVFNEQNKTSEVADDAYAEYQVPDDLIW